MEAGSSSQARQVPPDIPSAPPTARAVVYVVLVLLAVTQLQKYLVHDLYIVPLHLYHRVRRRVRVLFQRIKETFGLYTPDNGQRSRQHGSALASLPQKLAGIASISNHGYPQTIKPPGLGNLDSSCYQNSVIQALSSLSLFPSFIKSHTRVGENSSMKSALLGMMEALNAPSNAGKLFWLPPRLKNMNSWQQQDAQEYFSKVLEEIEGEIAKSVSQDDESDGLAFLASKVTVAPIGLGETSQGTCDTSRSPTLTTKSECTANNVRRVIRDPMEGLMAQRVGCLQCGYSEGLTMTPFRCLTLSLRDDWICSLERCLDDLIALESINDVECVKCTLIKHQQQVGDYLLRFHTSRGTEAHQNAQHDLLQPFQERFDVINATLASENYSDSALERCQISNKHRITSTKTRQAVIGRAPESLCIHINRSVFDERTGAQMKNTARLQYPRMLTLDLWCLGHEAPVSEVEHVPPRTVEAWPTDPQESLVRHHPGSSKSKANYRLKSVITHQGRHDNGHYVCFRQHDLVCDASAPEGHNVKIWWRFSDETVSEVEEDYVLNQGGVFMLFYEKTSPAVDSATHFDGRISEYQERNPPPNDSILFPTDRSRRSLVTAVDVSEAIGTRSTRRATQSASPSKDYVHAEAASQTSNVSPITNEHNHRLPTPPPSDHDPLKKKVSTTPCTAAPKSTFTNSTELEYYPSPPPSPVALPP